MHGQSLAIRDRKKELAICRKSERSAESYTLVEIAKTNRITPMKYLKYILTDIPGSAFLEHSEYLDDYLP